MKTDQSFYITLSIKSTILNCHVPTFCDGKFQTLFCDVCNKMNIQLKNDSVVDYLQAYNYDRKDYITCVISLLHKLTHISHRIFFSYVDQYTYSVFYNNANSFKFCGRNGLIGKVYHNKQIAEPFLITNFLEQVNSIYAIEIELHPDKALELGI